MDDTELNVNPFFKETPKTISEKLKQLSPEQKTELASALGLQNGTIVNVETLKSLGFNTAAEVDAKISAIEGVEPPTTSYIQGLGFNTANEVDQKISSIVIPQPPTTTEIQGLGFDTAAEVDAKINAIPTPNPPTTTDIQNLGFDTSEEVNAKISNVQGGGLTPEKEAEIIRKVAGDTIYISTAKGDNSNDGLSMLSPIASLSEFKRIIENDTSKVYTALLERGSVFKEPFLTNDLSYEMGAYGIGNRPVIDGTSEINEVDMTQVSGNLYSFSAEYGTDNDLTGPLATIRGRVVVFEDGEPMFCANTQAECESTPFSYVAENLDSVEPGTKTVFFHKRDGKTYTTNLRSCIVARGSGYVKIDNVDASGCWDQLGNISIQLDQKSSVNNCSYWNGNKHNAYFDSKTSVYNIECGAIEYQNGDRTSTQIVFFDNQNANNDEYHGNKIRVISNSKVLPFPNLRNGQPCKIGHQITGILDHVGTGVDVIGKSNLEDVVIKNCSISTDTDSLVQNHKDFFGNSLSDQIFRNKSNSFKIESSILLGEPSANSMSIDDTSFENCFVSNAKIFHEMATPSKGSRLLNFNNCVFLHTVGNSNGVQFLSERDNISTVKMFGTAVLQYGFVNSVRFGFYEGDYNIYYRLGGGGSNTPRFRVDSNASVLSLSDFQSATGQDANSVYLTKDQFDSFFLISPLSGQVLINPMAKVTGADGTVYTGTFPDGTRIEQKITNKTF